MEKPTFSLKFWESLADANPHGGRVDVTVVQAWFDWKWPKLEARGYRNMKRAVANWWAAITWLELEQAKVRSVQLCDDAENVRLERLANDEGWSKHGAERIRRRGRFQVVTVAKP